MVTMLASKMLYEDAESTGTFHSEAVEPESTAAALTPTPEKRTPTKLAPNKLEPLAEATAKDLVQLFKLLADETRLRILFYLMQEEELNVRTLCELLDQSQPAVSHHLALLRVAGMIECRRDGKHNFYHVVPRRCQQYLDVLFAASPQQKRRIRIEDSVLTYGREAHLGA